MKVVILPRAREELDAISDPLYSRVLKRLEALERFPEFGAPMTGPFAGWRSTVVDFFRIVYRVGSSRLEVAYIRDCRTLPSDFTDRRRNKPDKSAFIAQAVKEKFAAEDEARRKAALAKAYREAAEDESRLRDEWDALAGDGLA